MIIIEITIIIIIIIIIMIIIKHRVVALTIIKK